MNKNIFEAVLLIVASLSFIYYFGIVYDKIETKIKKSRERHWIITYLFEYKDYSGNIQWGSGWQKTVTKNKSTVNIPLFVSDRRDEIEGLEYVSEYKHILLKSITETT